MLKYFIFVSLPLLICSWWDVGHMLTAAIAQMRMNQLDIYTSANFRELTLAINNLCDNRTRTFIESSVWPDDIKDKKYSMDIWNDWHFMDTPFVTDATVPVINYTPDSFTSIWTVSQAKSALLKNINNLTAQRSLFARYLVHVVGDIHQPLHSVSLFNHTFPKGDAGGNLLKLKLLNGTVENFHSFWDSGAFVLQNDSYQFVRPMNLQNITELKRKASEMIERYGKEVQQDAKILETAKWAKQSFQIAKNTAYPFMMSSNVATEQYTRLVYETSLKRITLAGYRLANLVIQIYNPTFTQKEESMEQIKKTLLDHAEQSGRQLTSSETPSNNLLAE